VNTSQETVKNVASPDTNTKYKRKMRGIIKVGVLPAPIALWVGELHKCNGDGAE